MRVHASNKYDGGNRRGLFRLLPRGVQREDAKLLDAIQSTKNGHDSLEQYLRACEDASIFCQDIGAGRGRRGRGRGRGRGGHGPAELDPLEDEAEAPDFALEEWPIFTARALSRIGLSIQKELLGEQLISYLIEWCETPTQKVPGVCYRDTSIVYDALPGRPVTHKGRGYHNNLYVHIPHPLLDPVLADAKGRLKEFYARTFWCNFDVFQCCEAAQALAKRGINIDRCFIGVSPGGVGQSLYSTLLAAVYGHNHAFFDPNVWYADDELRKQVEQFAGCIILTGQEAPETSRRMREDLFKKTMSADGIAGRKPYGTTTKMMVLEGWKEWRLIN